MKIFISHSSLDSKVAHSLVALLRAALNVRPSEIRCTSVEGHRLAGGTQTDDALRREIAEAAVFVGLVSAASIESAYVLFEMGARWGQEKPIIPLLVPGASTLHLPGPLAGIHAHRSSSEEQLHQLVGEIGGYLQVEPNSPATYLEQLRALSHLTPELASPQALPEPILLEEIELADNHIQILRLFAEADWRSADVTYVARELQWKSAKVQHYFDELTEAGYLSELGDEDGTTTYSLTRDGRRFAVEEGLI